MLRPATLADASVIQAIYAPYVLETAISFELAVPSEEEMARRIETCNKTYPWLVCEREGAVAGYAYASRHRDREAYQWSVDVTVYVAKSSHRQGVGRELYTGLLNQLPPLGFVNAFAGIALPNDASVKLHQAMGFRLVGVYEKVGFKCGEWRDVSWWQRRLVPDKEMPAHPTPIRSR